MDVSAVSFAPRHFRLADLFFKDQNGVLMSWRRRQVPRRGLVKHNIVAYASLFGSGDIKLITLLFVRLANQNTLLDFGIQLPPLLLQQMHIRDATENPQVCEVRLLSEVQLVWRNSSIGRCPILELDGCFDRFGPIELRHMLLFQQFPSHLLYCLILPFGHAVLLWRVST